MLSVNNRTNTLMEFLSSLGDFNQAHLKNVLHRFDQFVKCKTRGENTIDHVYTNIIDAYKVIPCPHFGQSDHLSLFLVPAYKALVNCAKPTSRIVKVLSAVAINQLQDCFEHTSVRIRDIYLICAVINYRVDNSTVNKKIRV